MNTVAKIFLISLTIVAGAQAEDAKKLKPEIAQHDKMREAYHKTLLIGNTTPEVEKQRLESVYNATAQEIASPFKTLYENASKKLKAQNMEKEWNNAVSIARKTKAYKALLDAKQACRQSCNLQSNQCNEFYNLEKQFLKTNAGKRLAQANKKYLENYLKMQGGFKAWEYTLDCASSDTERAMKDGIRSALSIDNGGFNLGHTAEIYKKAQADLNKMADDICYEQ